MGEPGRLDAVVARLARVPRADVQRAIVEGRVTVDGLRRPKSFSLGGGERIVADLGAEPDVPPEVCGTSLTFQSVVRLGWSVAITMRSVTNLFSMFGTSDFGYGDSREFGGHAFDDPANYARQSPITYVKRIRTPLLILHAEGDLRCPIEQAEQLYTMLKAMKRKVEFIRFPEENHDLSRAGRPDRRIERLRRIQAWWRRYLGS